MYAIVQSGGRQVRVIPGDTVVVSRIDCDAGQEITFDQVLFIRGDGGDIISGSPFITNARVVGTADGEVRGPKIRVFHKKRRKGYRKTRGHRSTSTRVKIQAIEGGS